MAEEHFTKKYYQEIDRFIDPHQCCSLAIEQFLTEVLFKKDKTRVIYSSDDYCFRKRIELLDTKKGLDTKILEDIQSNIVSLDLPFASYFQTKNWEPDDRVYSVRADQMVLGQYDEHTTNYIQSMAVKSTYEGVCFYAYDEDARKAYQALQWEQNPVSPILLYSAVTWFGVNVLIPCFLSIDTLEFNPGFKESDRLKKSRITPIKFSFTLRSYEVLLENLGGAELQYKFQQKYSQGKNLYYGKATLAEKVTLQFLSEKGYTEKKAKQSSSTTNFGEASDYISPNAKRFFEPTENYAEKYVKDGALTEDILGSYFSTTPKAKLDTCKIVSATPTTLELKLKVNPSSMEFFDRIKVCIPGKEDIWIDDCKTKGCVIENLENNSTYHLNVFTYAKDGTVSQVRLIGETLNSPENKAPNPEGKTPPKKNFPSLIGYEF